MRAARFSASPVEGLLALAMSASGVKFHAMLRYRPLAVADCGFGFTAATGGAGEEGGHDEGDGGGAYGGSPCDGESAGPPRQTDRRAARA